MVGLDLTVLEKPDDPASYVQGQFYQINLTITNNISAVEEVNFTWEGVQYIPVQYGPLKYSFNVTDLPAGFYDYFWVVRLVTETGNISSNYTVAKATGKVDAFINGLGTDLSLSTDPSVINFSGRLVNGHPGASIQLYVNNSLWNNGTNNIENVTSLASGVYTLLVNYTGNQNYSSDFERYTLTITDGVPEFCGNITTETIQSGSNALYVQLCKNIIFGSLALKKDSTSTFDVNVYNPDGSTSLYIPETKCFMSLFYPNASSAISNREMSYVGNGIFTTVLNDSTLSTSGEWNGQLRCDNTADYGFSSFLLFVNPGGVKPNLFRTVALGIGVAFMFILGILLFMGFLFKGDKQPVRWTYFILSVTFFLIGINLISISLQDVIINPALEGFFDSFTAISFIFYWFAGGLLILLWIFTFFSTMLYRRNLNNMRRFGG